MSGLMRRLNRGRATTDDEAPTQAATSEAAGATTNAQPGASAVPAGDGATVAGEPARSEQATAVLAPGGESAPATGGEGGAAAGEDGATPGEGSTSVDGVGAGLDLPAGVDPGQLATAPTSARRGRLRRRLRYLRAVREILLRDLGGFYFEAQRSEQGVDHHRRLLDAKAARLSAVEAELRDLEARLAEARAGTVLREPGVGGTCPHCGELHASDARFCSRCGNPLGSRERAAAARAAAPTSAPVTSTGAVPVAAADDGAKASTASLWGRPKRPEASAPSAASAPARPSTAPEPVSLPSPPTPPIAQRPGAGADPAVPPREDGSDPS
jgi:hypothetical protein